jgi:predicted ATPase
LPELVRLLTEHRLVTLTGSGGSGKTRLALELAKRVAARLDQAASFVDLAPIADVRLVVSTIAATVHIANIKGKSGRAAESRS